MKRFPNGKADRILVVKWSALGDLVISTAIFDDLRRQFPSAQIDLNTSKPYLRLFDADPRFDRVIPADPKGELRRPVGLWRWARAMREGGYDLVVDLQSNDRSRLALSLLRLLSCGRTAFVGLHRRYPYHLAPEPGSPPGFALQQRALAAAGIPTLAERASLPVPERNRQRVRTLLDEAGLADGPFCVLIPGSNPNGLLKRWGAARYAALADALMQRGRGPSVLIGGPDDADECAAIAGLAAVPGSVVNLCSQTEILDIVALAEKACCVVANDTGPTHVASASGTPMLVICGPTDPRRVKPAGAHVAAIQAELDCINCYGKECGHHSCMAAVTVEMVLERLAAMTSGTKGC